jgi:hypothetical protein
MIAHVGQRVIPERIGKTDELPLIRDRTCRAVSAAVVVVVLGPPWREAAQKYAQDKDEYRGWCKDVLQDGGRGTYGSAGHFELPSDWPTQCYRRAIGICTVENMQPAALPGRFLF